MDIPLNPDVFRVKIICFNQETTGRPLVRTGQQNDYLSVGKVLNHTVQMVRETSACPL